MSEDLIKFILGILVAFIMPMVMYFFVRWEQGRSTTREAGEAGEWTYSDRLSSLVARLSKASSEFDTLLTDLEQVTIERARKAETLNEELDRLQDEEQSLRQRITLMEQTTPEAAKILVDYYHDLTMPIEQRNNRRDWAFFVAGVVAGLISNIVVNILVP